MNLTIPTKKSNCFDMISQYFYCKYSMKGNLPYDNFDYGSFVYEPKKYPNDKYVFNSLDNEFQTTFDCSLNKQHVAHKKFDNRTDAINYICNNILLNTNIADNEIRQAFHYYDN